MSACPYRPDDYITPSDAAKMIRRSPATIRLWLDAGKFTAFRLGGQWQIDRASFFLWIEAQKSQSSVSGRKAQ